MGAEPETTLQKNGNGVVDIVVDEKKIEKKMESDIVTAKSVQPSVKVEELNPSEHKKSMLPAVASALVVLTTGEHDTTTTNAEAQSQAPSTAAAADEAEVAVKTNKKTTREQAAVVLTASQQGEKPNSVARKSTAPLPVPVPVPIAHLEKEKVGKVEVPAAAAAKKVSKTKEKENENLTNISTLLLNDDEVATTLAAASEKLAAAHAKEKKKRKSGLSKFLAAFSPKRILVRFRDCYVNTCMMASEKGDFANLVAGHPGMFYASDNVMSRTSSQKRDRDQEEVLASLSRQVSASFSRQASQANRSRGSSPGLNRTTSTGLKRNASTGIPGLSRNASAGIAGLNRSGSTGMPSLSRQASTGLSGSTFGRNSSTRRHVPDSELFKAGRSTFLESLAAKNSGLNGNAAVNSNDSAPSLPSTSTTSALQPKKSL